MSTQNNLMRFVSVRPPRQLEEATRPRIVNDSAGTLFVKAVQTRKKEDSSTWSAARRAVAEEILASPDSFFRASEWSELRNARTALLELFRTEHDPNDPKSTKATDILGKYLLLRDLATWVNSQSYLDRKGILWKTYLAELFAPTGSVDGRQELLDWCRILHVVEHLATDASDHAGSEHLLSSRVTVSSSLFPASPARPDIDSHSKTPSREQPSARLESRINDLRQSRDDLQAIYRSKATKPGPVASSTKEPLQESATEPSGLIDQPNNGREPWIITKKDVASHRSLSSMITRLSGPSDALYIGEFLTAIDQEIYNNLKDLKRATDRRSVQGRGNSAIFVLRANDEKASVNNTGQGQ